MRQIPADETNPPIHQSQKVMHAKFAKVLLLLFIKTHCYTATATTASIATIATTASTRAKFAKFAKIIYENTLFNTRSNNNQLTPADEADSRR
ncbi:MAG TPA: hypothetical protein ENK52_00910 [Saprospiraceae bacterium]|nr:hypothetical protein [Saprospiraceae bacterium]